MMPSRFPAAGDAGAGAAGLVAGQSTAFFIPAADGSAPAGWTWLDGMLSNGYDQGSSAGDYVGEPFAPPYVFETPDMSTWLSAEGSQRYSILPTSTGWVSTTTSASSPFVVQFATLNVPTRQLQTAVVISGEVAGVTLDAPISSVSAVEVFSVTPGDDEWSFVVDLLLAVTTQADTSYLIRGQLSTFTGTFASVEAYAVPASFGGSRICFTRLDADTVLVTGAGDYLLDLTTGTVTAATVLVPNDLGGIRSSNLHHAGVLMDAWFLAGTPSVLLTAQLGAEATVTFTRVASGLPAGMSVLDDGTLFLLTQYGLWTADASGQHLAQRAGVHPALTTLPRKYVYRYAGVSVPEDYLNGPVYVSVLARDASQGFPGPDDVGKAVFTAQWFMNLGAMMSSFRRCAVYTG